MGFAKQWKGVNGYMIRDPGTFFTKYDESRGIGFPIAFMLVSFVAVMVPLAVLSAALNVTTPGDAAIGLVAFLALGVVFWVLGLVEALLAHGIVYLFGARGLAKTLEAYAFPTVVRYGLWWIPIVQLVGLYGFYLQIKGMAEFHGISTGKAAIAGILASILYFLPVIVVLAAVIAAFVLDLGSTAEPAPAVLLVEHVA
ncbi:YIP1 family protein [Halosolutus amylolyticus]|uniref:YIP1 family protein n=1 Tax=Halosolutus amylolyticus TaxID=2932267 RepID=A0ABD5PTE8_9EURY|nr:YIP1 family protein [Halosolutus amylolyticus]